MNKYERLGRSIGSSMVTSLIITLVRNEILVALKESDIYPLDKDDSHPEAKRYEQVNLLATKLADKVNEQWKSYIGISLKGP